MFYTEVIQPILFVLLRYAIYALGVLIAATLLYLLFAFVIPFAREKLGAERFDALVARVKHLMCVAERKFTEHNAGVMKSDFVITKILQVFPKLDPAYIQLMIDGLMAPLEEEGYINVTPETDFKEFIISAVTDALDKLPKITAAEAATDPNAAAIWVVANDLANIAVAVGAATVPNEAAVSPDADEDGAVYHDSHKPNPAPEVFDAPPVD